MGVHFSLTRTSPPYRHSERVLSFQGRSNLFRRESAFHHAAGTLDSADLTAQWIQPFPRQISSHPFPPPDHRLSTIDYRFPTPDSRLSTPIGGPHVPFLAFAISPFPALCLPPSAFREMFNRPNELYFTLSPRGGSFVQKPSKLPQKTGPGLEPVHCLLPTADPTASRASPKTPRPALPRARAWTRVRGRRRGWGLRG